ncbi:MAG: ShlB/FhaC/HecB family hemolysin secretion/activation protein [Phenylobacterium sp.]|uniref:ShlB/FhaC/HecB family hemolysin secretion/activation protein n=1 Tax=Phenylobacterium sp. TaxID=1871053 RepID=UPI001A617C62|nr:ShlB/FhaC/HecB family hemolysin secretion/activation protein [Phenylobacterium sp.]MBL8553216.1 ShlB/FhaC/HecB family hemolysin secretion/activation protein [Phenylobacterium sp.]
MGPTAARVCAAATMVVAAAPGVSFAQTAAAPSRQELNPAARAAPDRPPPDLFSAPGTGPCPLAENPAPLTVRSVTLNGLTSVPAGELAGSYADLLNRAGGDAADLCAIRDRVGDALFDRGILARVEIPPQTIGEDGRVMLDVIEARIVNVSVRGDAGPAAPILEAYAARLRGMTPFDVDKVQRYVLLASDVPGLKVRASIRPSLAQERGAVDLDLNVERDDEELIVNVQNLQAKATGRWGALARYDLNAQGRFGERTSLVAYRTVFHNEQWVVQALEEARLGGDGWVVRAGAAYGESRPGGAVKALGLKSKNTVVNLEASYPLVRRRRETLNLIAGFDLIDQDTGVGGAGRLINDDLRVVYARAEANRTYYAGYRPVLLTAEAGLRRGLEGFGATQEGDRLLSRSEARPSAWLVQGSASALAVVSPTAQLLARVEGQYSRQPLAAYEEYAVGSLTIGRGYDPAYVSGDSALAASIELRAGPYQPAAGWAFSPYAFFDVARTWDRDTGGRADTLSSVGVGFQSPVRGRWLLDVGYARPLAKRALDGARPPGRLLVNLTARFF